MAQQQADDDAADEIRDVERGVRRLRSLKEPSDEQGQEQGWAGEEEAHDELLNRQLTKRPGIRSSKERPALPHPIPPRLGGCRWSRN